MTDINYTFIHPAFRLNGFLFTGDDLRRVAFAFIKEGKDFEKQAGNFLLNWLDDNDYIIMHTSGTTGNPKQIKIPKQAMVNSALATGMFFDLPAHTKALLCLPAQYIAGKMMFVRALILGWELDIVEPSSRPLEGITATYDFSAMVPLQAKESLKDLYRIKKLILGGAKVSRALADTLKDWPTEVYETYGMTETVSHIAVKKIGEEAFTLLPNVLINTDERQCLVINAENINPDTLITNDVVTIVDDNHFIWMGRYDNVINSGGVKIFPEQIEEKLSGHIKNRFFVTAIPDETLGYKPALVIEGKPYDISENVFKALDKYEKPKEVLFTEQFAETASGKIIRDKSLALAL